MTWGFVAFPARPIVFAFEGSLGVLGKAFAAGFEARIGVMQGPFECSVGWRERWFGRLALGGPFLGISYWL